jgi:hypothetical protein
MKIALRTNRKDEVLNEFTKLKKNLYIYYGEKAYCERTDCENNCNKYNKYCLNYLKCPKKIFIENNLFNFINRNQNLFHYVESIKKTNLFTLEENEDYLEFHLPNYEILKIFHKKVKDLCISIQVLFKDSFYYDENEYNQLLLKKSQKKDVFIEILNENQLKMNNNIIIHKENEEQFLLDIHQFFLNNCHSIGFIYGININQKLYHLIQKGRSLLGKQFLCYTRILEQEKFYQIENEEYFEFIDLCLYYEKNEDEINFTYSNHQELDDKIFKLKKEILSLCQVQNCRLSSLLYRGISFRIENMLHLLYLKSSYFLPAITKKDSSSSLSEIAHKKRLKQNDNLYELIGGFNLDPKIGYYINQPIYVYDFNSLYPSIIRMFNLCFTTTTEDDNKNEDNNCSFLHRNEKLGILTLLMDELISKRLQAKNQKDFELEFALKLTANAIYGILGSKFSYYYNLKIANFITEKGRFLLQGLMHQFKEDEIIAAVTDSIFILSKDDPKLIDLKIQNDFMKVWLKKQNIPNFHLLKIKFEYCSHNSLIYNKNMMVFKLDEENMIIKGLPMLNQQSCNLVKNFTLQFLRLYSKTIDEKLEFIKRFIQKNFPNPPLQDCIFKVKLKKQLKEYPQNLGLIQMVLNEKKQNYRIGDYIKYFTAINNRYCSLENQSQTIDENYYIQLIQTTGESLIYLKEEKFKKIKSLLELDIEKDNIGLERPLIEELNHIYDSRPLESFFC